MAKKAVVIGINYPGTKAELKGCINDVWRMRDCLINRYGFSDEDITVLIDTDKSYMKPTGKNIRSAIKKLVGSAESGDILVVHYSGHGTRLPAETGEEDDTGYDECIVPCDMNLITDDDFKEFVEGIPRGCKMTILADSCHSGGLISDAKEQIGESTQTNVKDKESHHHSTSASLGFRGFLHRTVEEAIESRGIHIHRRRHNVEDDEEEEEEEEEQQRDFTEVARDDDGEEYEYVKSRSLPLSTLIEMLKQKTGKDDIDVGKLRITLFDIFKDEASPKVKKFIKFVFNELKHGGGSGEHSGGFLGKVGKFLKQKLEEHDEEEYAQPAMETHIGSKQEVYAGSTNKGLPDGAILISGCQSNQTSADASPAGNSANAYGAFSNSVQSILKESHGELTNQDLVLKARKKLKSQGFPQRPGLYCTDHQLHASFVC